MTRSSNGMTGEGEADTNSPFNLSSSKFQKNKVRAKRKQSKEQRSKSKAKTESTKKQKTVRREPVRGG